jgi:hypothetical protein
MGICVPFISFSVALLDLLFVSDRWLWCIGECQSSQWAVL